MSKNDNVVAFRGKETGRQPSPRLVPERLTEARLAAGLTQTEIAAKVGVSRQAISAYEGGEKSPEPVVLARIAAELAQPVIHFTKESRPSFGKHGTNFFRKTGADTKRRNQACSVYSEWFANVAFAFDKIANFPKVDLPAFEPASSSSSYTDEEIEEYAEVTRKYFGLGLGPITNMVRLVETKGILVCRYVMKNQKVDAFSFWNGHRPFIFLSSDKNSSARARFDVAHEMAHLCLHRWIGQEEIEDDKRLERIENEADRFAGAFLLPRKSFPLEVYSPRAESFIDLKARWKVSIQAMVYRCKDLFLFDDRQVTNIYKQISYKKWRTKEPLDDGPKALQLEEPILLSKVADLVLQSGRYAVEEFVADVALADNVVEQMIGMKLPDRRAENADLNPTLK